VTACIADERSFPIARFLIEVSHDRDAIACARAQQVFLGSGSHYLTHADWGCKDGVHCAWIIVEGESSEEVRGILPPADRPGARIVALTGFEEALTQHRVGGVRDGWRR
jgi:hypothetical protein